MFLCLQELAQTYLGSWFIASHLRFLDFLLVILGWVHNNRSVVKLCQILSRLFALTILCCQLAVVARATFLVYGINTALLTGATIV